MKSKKQQNEEHSPPQPQSLSTQQQQATSLASHPRHANSLISSFPSNRMSPKKQTPITLVTALRYLDKIKERFASQPEIYESFLEIFKVYMRDATPSQVVFAQVTQLLSAAPDLVEDFKQFLPDPAAASTEVQVAAAASEFEKLTI